jgi:Holliday junction resolvase RusA-like endonuclease
MSEAAHNSQSLSVDDGHLRSFVERGALKSDTRAPASRATKPPFEMIAFEIPGEAVPFARTRGETRFTPAKQRDFMDAVAYTGRTAMMKAKMDLMEGPLRLMIRCEYVPPSSWSTKKKDATRWKTSKPDLDNLTKLASDALNRIVYNDDAQICELSAQKVYGLSNRLIITVHQLERA